MQNDNDEREPRVAQQDAEGLHYDFLDAEGEKKTTAATVQAPTLPARSTA
jgi:hypothetical protein